LLGAFMSDYYPDTTYSYFPEKRQVKSILIRSKLISADGYNEEDVIEGVYKGSNFYFSEIHLENESGDSSSTKFKGILFNLKLTGKNFPTTRIQSTRNLSQMLFSSMQKDEAHNLWYQTDDETAYKETMHTLLPFITHLQNQQGEIRLYTEGNNITMIMESRMRFLDEPEPMLDHPLDNRHYKANLARQMHTLLFIVDAFVNDLDSSEIEEQLELKTIELADNSLNNS